MSYKKIARVIDPWVDPQTIPSNTVADESVLAECGIRLDRTSPEGEISRLEVDAYAPSVDVLLKRLNRGR